MFLLPEINAYNPRVVLPRQPSAGRRRFVRVAKEEHDHRRVLRREECQLRAAMAAAFVTDVPKAAAQFCANDILRQEALRREMVSHACQVEHEKILASRAIDFRLQKGRDADPMTRPAAQQATQQRQIFCTTENARRLDLVYSAVAELALINVQVKEAVLRIHMREGEIELRSELGVQRDVQRPASPPLPAPRAPYPPPPRSGQPWARPVSASHYAPRDSILAVLEAHRRTNEYFQLRQAARALQRLGHGFRGRVALMAKYRRVTDPTQYRHGARQWRYAGAPTTGAVYLPALATTA
eukprot:TRINITY_DN32950_c0_g1_i1.p1 TRINITY_DN32950_c0_g1~~TRINITY_DN32950_c0_g1_i1.p1  ORF type:complete len:297 (+),score=74.79 TRINITY_DN32950_c0_g1_i1:89-979(+)